MCLQNNFSIFLIQSLNIFNLLIEMKRQYPQLKQQDILKRLEHCGVTTQKQYKKIIQNLKIQNERLFDDLTSLKNKVVTLQQKQKKKQRQRKKQRDNPQDVYQRTKNQLERKYKEFDLLRKKVAKRYGSQPLNLNLKEYLNQIFMLDKQINQAYLYLKDAKKQKKKINKSLKSHIKQSKINLTSVYSIEDDNKYLKKQVWQLRKITDQQQQKSVKIQNNVIGSRRRIRNTQRLMTLNQLKDSKVSQRTEIYLQFNRQHRLKTQTVQYMESQLTNRKQINISKEKQTLEHKNKLLLRSLKGIQSTKNRLIEQYKSLTQSKPTQYQASICQTNETQQFANLKYQEVYPLRKEYFGKTTPNEFNDRNILKNQKSTCITGVQIFQNQKGIAAIKAFYSNGLSTQLPIPQQYLQTKCKVHKVTVAPGDYLINFIIKYNKDKRIIGVQIVSNEEHTYEVRLKKYQYQYQQYLFDINDDQWPSSIFGTFKLISSAWCLSSFGVEINSQLK